MYHYVGPAELRFGDTGTPVRSWADVEALGAGAEPFTYVVALDGTLRLAPRRHEPFGLRNPGHRTALGGGSGPVALAVTAVPVCVGD
jgi:hypothetical protein